VGERVTGAQAQKTLHFGRCGRKEHI